MAKSILSLLVCPLTKQDLFLLKGDKAEQMQMALSRGELHYIDGTKIPGAGGQVRFLISKNAHQLYSVIDGVPVLLESKQVDTRTLNLQA
jgi:uncharacterized protein YbaR (Trm112 family)